MGVISFEALKPAAPPSTKDTTDCPVKFAGKYSFDARLTNRSGLAFSNLSGRDRRTEQRKFDQYSQRAAGSQRVVRCAGNGGIYVDYKLQPGETVKVPFTVCMEVWKPFRLLVNVAVVAQ